MAALTRKIQDAVAKHKNPTIPQTANNKQFFQFWNSKFQQFDTAHGPLKVRLAEQAAAKKKDKMTLAG
jgi:hypothetical protein